MTVPNRGYLYVVKPKYKDGPFKIGIARDLGKRLDNLQTAHHEQLEAFLAVEMDNPRELEKALHRQFRDYRIRGEWFAANRHLYESLLSLPGVFTPLWMRDTRVMPNRPWHAALAPTEIAERTCGVNWPKWDEAATLRH